MHAIKVIEDQRWVTGLSTRDFAIATVVSAPLLKSYGYRLFRSRQGGLLCGDDYGESGWWKGGVERAVNESASNNIVKIVSLQHSQFCLEKNATGC